MAIRIPTYDSAPAQEAALPVAVRQIHATPEAYGASVDAAMAQAASPLLQTAGRIAQQAQDEADRAAVQEALNKQKLANEQMLNQLRQAQGKDAAQASIGAYGQADKLAADLSEGLDNDRQRRLFAEHANQELIEVRRIGEAHVAQQVEAYKDTQYAGAQAISLNRAATNADRLDVVDSEVQQVEQRVAEQAQRRGLSPEAAQALRNQEVGKLRQAQIEVLLGREQYDVAQAIIGMNREALGPHLDELEQRAKKGSDLARSDATAQVIANDPDVQGSYGIVDEGKALEKVDQLPPGHFRDMVRERVRQRVSDSKSTYETRRQTTFTGAVSAWMNQSQDATQRDWRRLPSVILNQLDGEQEYRLDQMQRADRSAAEGQPLTPEQERAYGRLLNDFGERATWWASQDEGALVSNGDYAALPQHYRVAFLTRLGALHQDKSDPTKLISSNEKVVKAAAVRGGVLQGDVSKGYDAWDQHDQDNWVELNKRLDLAVSGWMENHPKERVTPSVMDSLVREVSRGGTVQKRTWRWLGIVPTARPISRIDAERRPSEDQQSRPFHETYTDEERQQARDLKLRMGLDPKVQKDAFTDEALNRQFQELEQAKLGFDAKQQQLAREALSRAGVQDPTPQQLEDAYLTARFRLRRPLIVKQ